MGGVSGQILCLTCDAQQIKSCFQCHYSCMPKQINIKDAEEVYALVYIWNEFLVFIYINLMAALGKFPFL